MVLLDTNVIIEFWKQNPVVRHCLADLGNTALTISTVTEAELLVGARDTQDLRHIQRALRQLHVLPIEPAICGIMAKLLGDYVLSNRLKMPDALIAATALHHGLPLYAKQEGLPLHRRTSPLRAFLAATRIGGLPARC